MLILTVICTAAMLFMPSQSIEGAADGINLCLTAVIPSLFPFFICSRMLINSGIAEMAGRKAGRIFEALFGINRNCAFAFAAGILSGYPVGAKVTGDMYKNGLCSKAEAQRMLAFCNNSGPLFIIGTVGVGMLRSARAGLLLYIAHVLSALAVGITIRFVIPAEHKGRKCGISFHTSSLNGNFQDALADSVKSMAMVCGNIIFFSVIIAALKPIFGQLFASSVSRSTACGIIEISTGISMLGGNYSALPVIGFLLAWSGISVIMQVNGIISPLGLSTGVFAVSKLMQGIYGGLFTLLLIKIFPVIPPALTLHLPAAAHTAAIVIISAALLTLTAIMLEKFSHLLN